MHLLDLAQYVKEGVLSAGLVGFRFNTVGVSDAISMGTDGMSYRYYILPATNSRELNLEAT